MIATVVSMRATASRAAATVRSGVSRWHVLDLDGTFPALPSVIVSTPADVGIDAAELAAKRDELDPDRLERWAHALLARHVLSTESALVAVRPGVLVIGDPTDLLDRALAHGVAVTARDGAVDDGLWPGIGAAAKLGAHGEGLIAVGSQAAGFVDDWQLLATEGGDRWLDVAVSRHRHEVIRDDRVISAWSATVNLPTALALDLSALDPAEPWLLDARATATPRVRLSEHRDVAELVERYVADVTDETVAEPVGALSPPDPEPATLTPATARDEGVNVVGYLSGELGIGESARLMLDAIDAADVPHSTVAVTKHLRSRQTATYRAASSDTLFDTTLLCVNAKETPSVSASVAEVVKGTYRIGMWYWETEDFPRSQHKGFRHVNEVWVATDFIRSAIEPHSPVPVRTMMPPLPQPGSHLDPSAARMRLGLPDRPILLFAFDYASIAERKNPWGLVDAFEAAFAPGEGPLLVIKSISGDRNPAQAERLRLRVGASPDVRLIEDYLDTEDRDALMAACDCYISLHRSEGLGLTMAEAMSMGKPVIATAYGGNLQFMTDENSYLVPYARVEIPHGAGPYTPGETWADPDLDTAARLIRTVFEDLTLAAERGRQAAHDLRTQHSPQVAGRAVADRLAQIRAERAAASEPPSRSARSVARRLLGR